MRLRIGGWAAEGPSIDLRQLVADDHRADDRESATPGPFNDHPGTAASTSTVSAPTTPSLGTIRPSALAARIASAVEAPDEVPLRTDRPAAGPSVAVDCDQPPSSHEPLRRHPVDGPLRSVLAAAARSRGLSASVADAIADRREALREQEVPEVDLDAARKRLAAATGEEERLRERVAALRGELRAHRDLDADVEAVREQLQAATTELSAAETERIAAEQALDRAVDRAREARDARERRLELEDEVANLEREARRELAAEIQPTVRDALGAIPGGDPASAGDASGSLPGDDPDSFACDVATVALAAVRVAAIDAPVVLGPSVDRFSTAAAAHDVLDCPVIRV
ncbi:hypothetical protein [Haloparvum sp. PAK95]|uniref:DUF7856 family protein n=1 Tax=Haloparvum sp. PAK95 TaxID=3418962 RepID=UPI003D2F3AD7